MDSTYSLAGRHALVTGGGSGIGAAAARALLSRGARVTLAGRDIAALSATAAELKSRGEVDYVAVDVAYRTSVTQGFERASVRFGPVDILVNNAGQAASAPFAKTDEAMWQQMLTVNLTGTYHCIQAALPAMLENRWGRIVNVASTAGLIGYGYVTAYCAAKHGVIGLTRALALEVAARGVTVNAVCPGYTDTDIVRNAIDTITARTGRTTEQARAELTARNPQGRLVRPEEVADTVAWLCLPGSAAMNGQSLAVAGGEVM
ncbi:MAG: 3-hydroxyacyl-CoA dehydrogenase [Noviherbaspirillum sp.]|jgi:3-hydroxybutyrate dehydrogenase|nr:3-hydroxyacyl-CoA dehydrogenase [Noviherbaspirillum sp.]